MKGRRLVWESKPPHRRFLTSSSRQLETRDFEVPEKAPVGILIHLSQYEPDQSASFAKTEAELRPWFNWKLLPVRLEVDNISSLEESWRYIHSVFRRATSPQPLLWKFGWSPLQSKSKKLYLTLHCSCWQVQCSLSKWISSRSDWSTFSWLLRVDLK